MYSEKILNLPAYQFLTENKFLGKNIIYLTISGSKAYGTSNENSDTDIRGVAVESLDDILTGKSFEQIEDDKTDTVIYSLRKFFKLCAECNPNVLEMLGTRQEDILFINDAGKKIRDNAEIFLSKLAYKKFVGYATAQLRRLQNALARDSYPVKEKNLHIMKSIESMMLACKNEYGLNNAKINFELGEEILISVDAKNLPLKKFLAMNAGLNTMLNNYAKLNHRNRKKDDNHLNKHAMHLIRLYLTGIDILEGRGVITRRENDLPLLKKIRAGEIPYNEIFKMVNDCEEKILAAYENSRLPDSPDENKIDALLLEIYKNCIKDLI